VKYGENPWVKDWENPHSAKHLEVLPSLLEGRRSIQLSYGRILYTDSKTFIASTATVLRSLTVCAQDRRSFPLSHKARLLIVIQLSYIGRNFLSFLNRPLRCCRYSRDPFPSGT